MGRPEFSREGEKHHGGTHHPAGPPLPRPGQRGASASAFERRTLPNSRIDPKCDPKCEQSSCASERQSERQSAASGHSLPLELFSPLDLLAPSCSVVGILGRIDRGVGAVGRLLAALLLGPRVGDALVVPRVGLGEVGIFRTIG